MRTYQSKAKELNAHQELRSALVELGFKSGMPSILTSPDVGRFWLLANDAEKMKKIAGGESDFCIETEKRKYIIAIFPTHKATECTFIVMNKESNQE